MKIPVLWQFNCRGNWDHNMVMSALSGDLWPTYSQLSYEQVGFEDKLSFAEGCVVVLPGGHCASIDYQEAAKDFVLRRSWVLAIIVSDECALYSCDCLLADNCKVWVQMPSPKQHGAQKRVAWTFPSGPRSGLRDVGRSVSLRSGERDKTWFFAGRVSDDARRASCVSVLESLLGDLSGHCVPTTGFARGLEYREYLDLLGHAKLAPCPAGAATADSFRVFEALEMGTLPVLDSRARDFTYPNNDYWSYACSCNPEDIPIPRVSDWGQFPLLLIEYLRDPIRLKNDTNLAVAWWMQYKRNFVSKLEDTIAELSHSNLGLPHETLVLDVRGLRSADELVEMIRKFRAEDRFSSTEILVALDREDDTEELRKLLWSCNWDDSIRGCLPVFSPSEVVTRLVRTKAFEVMRV